MPRLLVMTEDRKQVLVDEIVHTHNLDNPWTAARVLEALVGGLEGAENAEARIAEAMSYREVPVG